MIDALVVGLIIVAAVGYIVYRFAFKKSGGCGCGGSSRNGSGCCGSGDAPSSSCCRK